MWQEFFLADIFWLAENVCSDNVSSEISIIWMARAVSEQRRNESIESRSINVYGGQGRDKPNLSSRGKWLIGKQKSFIRNPEYPRLYPQS